MGELAGLPALLCVCWRRRRCAQRARAGGGGSGWRTRRSPDCWLCLNTVQQSRSHNGDRLKWGSHKQHTCRGRHSSRLGISTACLHNQGAGSCLRERANKRTREWCQQDRGILASPPPSTLPVLQARQVPFAVQEGCWASRQPRRPRRPRRLQQRRPPRRPGWPSGCPGRCRCRHVAATTSGHVAAERGGQLSSRRAPLRATLSRHPACNHTIGLASFARSKGPTLPHAPSSFQHGEELLCVQGPAGRRAARIR